MSKNKIQCGEVMPYAAPAGGVLSGGGYLIGALFVVAGTDAAAGATFQGDTEGVYTLTKTANEGAWVEGQPVYWDVAGAKASIDPTKGLPIGTVAAAALTGDVVGNVRLNGVPLAGRPLTLRAHVPIATVNAGGTLIPALPGLCIRVHDELALAVGGAAGTGTAVVVGGTQAAGAVALVTHPQANLTRSAVNRMGAAGGTVLADGASFAKCDVNTPVTIGKTGAAFDTATFIDVEITYSLEP